MTPSDLTASLAALGLSQARFARLVGVDKGTVNRWACARKEAAVPRWAVVTLLALQGLALADIERH